MRILVVDSSASLRNKLISLIEDIPNVDIVGEASTWDETVRFLEDLDVEIVILDVHVLDPPETQTLQRLKAANPQLKAILLAEFFTPEYEHAYRKAGADFVCDKSLGFERVATILTNLGKK